MRRSTCKHFNGMMHDTCDAGVNYRMLVGGEDFGWMARSPCIPDSPLRKGGMVHCDKYCMFTDAEYEENFLELKKHGEYLITAAKRIKETKQQNGIIECPKCNGKMGFSVAKSNGHIWAKCKTPGCLIMMQ